MIIIGTWVYVLINLAPQAPKARCTVFEQITKLLIFVWSSGTPVLHSDFFL